MCEKNSMKITLDSEIFKNMKDDFNSFIGRILNDMDKRNVDDATITMKLSISLDRDDVIKPTFKHDISSIMQVKDKKTGSVAGEYEMVYDDDEGEWAVRPITNGQMNLFDDENLENVEYVEAEPYDEGPSEPLCLGAGEETEADNDTPFGWMKQFVGSNVIITESMGNYTARVVDEETGKEKVVLSSASSPDNIFHCQAEKLEAHVGHSVSCVGFHRGDSLVNITVKCDDCNEVLYSIDKYPIELPEEYADEGYGEYEYSEEDDAPLEECSETDASPVETFEDEDDDEDLSKYAYEIPEDDSLSDETPESFF